jgi:4'-phosphopantetheinyl transferase
VSVRVVSARLDPPEPRLRELFARLDAAERARAERFVFEQHRRRFTAARGLLRETLAEELGLDPGGLRFEYAARGKPSLAAGQGAGLRFNLSHSEDRLLIAIGRELELGVDIERVRDDIEHDAIARRFFSEAERAALLAQPVASRAAAFFVIWTRKEAYIKLLGGGLSIPLATFEVSLGSSPRLLRGALEGAELRPVEAPPGFAAALAVAPPGAISQDR